MNKYVKYTLIALAGAGLIYGGYKLYQHLSNNGFQIKFGRKIKVVNQNIEE